MALLLALAAILVILSAVTLVMSKVHFANKNTDFAIDRALLDEVCKAGIDYGVQQLWGGFLAWLPEGEDATLSNYHSFLETELQLLNNEHGADSDGDGVVETADPISFDLSGVSGAVFERGVQLTSVVCERTDDISGMNIAVTARAAMGDQVRELQQRLRVGGRLFKGFDYAVFANNINCLVCHLDVKPLGWNDPAAYGTHNRVKVACLEDLMVNVCTANFGYAESHIAGSVYTRGRVGHIDSTVANPKPITEADLNNYANNFSSYQYDAYGKIIQNPANGSMYQDPFTMVDCAGKTELVGDEKNASFYLNYPEEATVEDNPYGWDGRLPDGFPYPYPEDFSYVTNSATGALSGFGAIVPEGTQYNGGSTTGLGYPSSVVTIDGSVDGNVFLYGTSAHPIDLGSPTGDQPNNIAINGDLVITGVVKGFGNIQVKGNIYVLGDVTYENEDFTGTNNGLALTAGKSIMIGDYLTRRGYNFTSPNWQDPHDGIMNLNFANASKSTSMTQRVSGRNFTTTKDCGYWTANAVDLGKAPGTRWSAGEDIMSFSMCEIVEFNQMEYYKWQQDSSYTPRFYRVRDKDSSGNPMPVYRFDREESLQQLASYPLYKKQHPYHYHNYTASSLAPGIHQITPAELPANAQFCDLNPQNTWMTEEQLRQFYWKDIQTRIPTKRPVLFDGLLYSSNAIFCVSQGSNHSSTTEGKMRIRGAMCAADLGVLSAYDLQVLYDPRVDTFLRVEDRTQVTFTRGLYWDAQVAEGAA
jgi:hypothetical protein